MTVPAELTVKVQDFRGSPSLTLPALNRETAAAPPMGGNTQSHPPVSGYGAVDHGIGVNVDNRKLRRLCGDSDPFPQMAA